MKTLFDEEAAVLQATKELSYPILLGTSADSNLAFNLALSRIY